MIHKTGQAIRRGLTLYLLEQLDIADRCTDQLAEKLDQCNVTGIETVAVHFIRQI